MPDRRPILVTGSHRSGTGWVGQMMAATPAPPVAYLWEPFSLRHRRGICDARFPYWFPYICRENESSYRASIADMLSFRYKATAELRAARSAKDLGRMARDWRRFARYRRRGARPLLKDPIAIFSAEWLCDTFEMDVVVLIRHPAAFANSLIRLGWTHPFDHFVKQPLLTRDLLGPFEEELRAFAAEEPPILEQAILLWNVINHAILVFRDRRPDWVFLRLEDIALDPPGEFGKLYARFGLTFDERVLGTIDAHSDASNPAEADSPSDVRRDSRSSIVTWKRRLTEDEINRIRTGVDAISKEFYADADW